MSQQKAVIYCRYSSHNQRDVSIEQQLKACRSYAQSIGAEVVKVYDDHALTGTNDRRPAFQQMIAEAASLDYALVIVYSLDRFSRDRYDSAIYKHKLKEYGKRVVSATENITDDPAGLLMESVLEGFAAYYSAELARKIKRGMEHNAERCMVTGSLPYGYTKGPDGRYAIHPEQAEVVREIYARVISGEYLSRIIDDLNRRGLRTKSGAAWNRSSFNAMLHNERYTGVYIYGSVRVPGGVPAILDRSTFDAAQDALKTKSRPRRGDGPIRRRRENGVYLLTGKLYCSRCGSPMVGISGKSTADRINYYYVCKGRREKSGCDAPMIRREKIEQEIAAAIMAQLTPERIALLVDAFEATQEAHSAASASDLAVLREQLASVEKGLENIVRAVERGFDVEGLLARSLSLEQRRKELREQVAAAELEAVKVTREDVEAMLYLFAGGDPKDAEKHEALYNAFLVRAEAGERLDIIISILGENVEISTNAETLVDMSDCIKLFGGGCGTLYNLAGLGAGVFLLRVSRA